ncbi:hypothetical protein BJX62DRAFT_245090 [Aspergillus germanicus]
MPLVAGCSNQDPKQSRPILSANWQGFPRSPAIPPPRANPTKEDVFYCYTNNYGNNDRDSHGPQDTDVGDDPYGFIVLDGDDDALQVTFHQNFVFTHDNDGTDQLIQKREVLTRDDPNLMDWVFEHEESFHRIIRRARIYGLQFDLRLQV